MNSEHNQAGGRQPSRLKRPYRLFLPHRAGQTPTQFALHRIRQTQLAAAAWNLPHPASQPGVAMETTLPLSPTVSGGGTSAPQHQGEQPPGRLRTRSLPSSSATRICATRPSLFLPSNHTYQFTFSLQWV